MRGPEEAPCFCGHGLGDHRLDLKAGCGIHGCRCDEYEQDGEDLDADARRDEAS